MSQIECEESKGLIITDKPITNKPLVCAVLNYYGIDFLCTNGELFVKEKMLNADRSLYWNILLKAADSAWIKSHLKLKAINSD
ncbi:hypothetical protein GCM10011379_26880 [Filimonas zeae]|uniref:Uncharacterized protein n=1 Tax=Filimonas zeae TaxID=1737353 RepID=A0A917J039_9BACT|nr:hypothetical protein GCM10011379_26880 [Filimonas zeae]